MQVTPSDAKNRRILSASGRFDAAGSKTVADALDRALAAGSHTVELDLSGVDYLSSAGIRILVTYAKKFSVLKGGLYVTGADDRICRLLEMTGLYSLLDSPQDGDEPVQAQQYGPGGLLFRDRVLEPDGRFAVRTIGMPDVPAAPVPAEKKPETLAFPATVLAFGTGAFGYEAGECEDRMGPFLAAGGFAAFRPRGGDPDFEEYAESFIPLLHVRSGIALTGNYARSVVFESSSDPPGLNDIIAILAGGGAGTATGFIIAAECEVPDNQIRLPGRSGAPLPAIASADGSRLCLALVAGIAGIPRKYAASPQSGQVMPGHDAGIPVRGCAAFFSYRPLRRHGNVTLKDTVVSLFDLDLLDIVPPGITGKDPVITDLRLLRGLAWTAPAEGENR